MIIALCLNVGVCKQKDRQNDGNDVPSGEYKTRSVSFGGVENALHGRHSRECISSTTHVPGIIPRRERHHSRDL
jgi:hypothetical protein